MRVRGTSFVKFQIVSTINSKLSSIYNLDFTQNMFHPRVLLHAIDVEVASEISDLQRNVKLRKLKLLAHPRKFIICGRVRWTSIVKFQILTINSRLSSSNNLDFNHNILHPRRISLACWLYAEISPGAGATSPFYRLHYTFTNWILLVRLSSSFQ